MSKETTLFSSIINLKCPKCREGDLFKTSTLSFQKSFDMPKNCPHCNQKYFLEPGFYYGAMFISYIFTGWFCIAFAVVVHWVFDYSLNVTFFWMILILAIFFVYIFRSARSLWIHVNVKYDPTIPKK